mmetsp:Transcript_20946/g.67417  ORF Transcript_20946/g.67417 Transcript_20946/m.67417 type:complete len:329 (-) Transcript_20946:464-1450(-)
MNVSQMSMAASRRTSTSRIAGDISVSRRSRRQYSENCFQLRATSSSVLTSSSRSTSSTDPATGTVTTHDRRVSTVGSFSSAAASVVEGAVLSSSFAAAAFSSSFSSATASASASASALASASASLAALAASSAAIRASSRSASSAVRSLRVTSNCPLSRVVSVMSTFFVSVTRPSSCGNTRRSRPSSSSPVARRTLPSGHATRHCTRNADRVCPAASTMARAAGRLRCASSSSRDRIARANSGDEERATVRVTTVSSSVAASDVGSSAEGASHSCTSGCCSSTDAADCITVNDSRETRACVRNTRRLSAHTLLRTFAGSCRTTGSCSA